MTYYTVFFPAWQEGGSPPALSPTQKARPAADAGRFGTEQCLFGVLGGAALADHADLDLAGV